MVEIKMPQLGESVAEGTVTQWHVKPGDSVRREQPLLEVATDKADSEVPSPTDGVVSKIVAAEGAIVATGGLLCVIDESASAGKTAGETADERADERADEEPKKKNDGATQPAPAPERRRKLTTPSISSPSTRKLAREEGIDLSVLQGSGDRGRITREDVQRAAGRSASPSAPPSMPGPPPSRLGIESMPPSQGGEERSQEMSALMNVELPIPGVGYRSYKVPAYREKPGDKIVPFTRRRRITADHMVYSVNVAPHVVAVAEIDLAKVDKLRDQHKDAFKKEGIPLTFLAFVVAAVVKALREHPTLNARVLDDSYVVLKDINVGIAVDTPNGLLVANIKHTDQLSMRGIASSIDEVASRARDGKITADDLMGTTFTVSNPGRKGNLFGGAIISQPNVGILRIGEIKKRPVVIDKDGDDVIAIHPVMFAALSYDHRIVDGVEANSFLWRITDVLGRGELEIG